MSSWMAAWRGPLPAGCVISPLIEKTPSSLGTTLQTVSPPWKEDHQKLWTRQSHFRLTRSGTNSSFSNWMVWCGCEIPLGPMGGKVMKVESPKADPLFSVRTTTPFPPPNWFTGGQSGFLGSSLESLAFTADTSPDGDEKTCAGPFPPVLVDEIASLKVPFSNIVKD